MRTLIATVSILFMTPMTVYIVAVKIDWHEKPDHEMPKPMMQDVTRHIIPGARIRTDVTRLQSSSPESAHNNIVGAIESVLVYMTNDQVLLRGIVVKNLPSVETQN